jgi:hypothetical protein
MYSHIHFYTMPTTPHKLYHNTHGNKKNMFPETGSVNLSGWRHHTSATYMNRVQTCSINMFQLTYGSYHASDIHKLHLHTK